MESPTLSLSTLPSWTPSGTVIAVLGPQAQLQAHLHQLALASLTGTHPELLNWHTVAVEATAAELPALLKALHALRVWALIITPPLKGPALQLLSPDFTKLAEKPDFNPTIALGLGSADATAERVAATSLCLWRAGGYWGTCSEGPAFSRALPTAFAGTPFATLRGQTITLLGAGALARAIAVEALTLGCHELWMGSRQMDSAMDALSQVCPSPQMQARVHSFGLQKLSKKLPTHGLVINTLPHAARATPTAQFDLSRYDPATTAYFDVLHQPTALSQQALALGMPTSLGGQLYVGQIAYHLQLLTGGIPPAAPLLAALATLPAQ